MSAKEWVKGAYLEAMPYPLGGAVWLFDQVIVEPDHLGWRGNTGIAGAI